MRRWRKNKKSYRIIQRMREPLKIHLQMEDIELVRLCFIFIIVSVVLLLLFFSSFSFNLFFSPFLTLQMKTTT